MKALKHINKYFLKYKWRFLLGFFFVIISNFFAIYPAKLTGNIINQVKETIEQNVSKSPEEKLEILKGPFMYYFIAVVAYFLLKGIFLFLMRQTIIVMSRLIERDMKNELFQHYEALSLSFYRRNNTGDLMNRISEDVSRVRMYIGPCIMYTLNLAALFIMVVATMLDVNVRLTLYVLTPLPVMAVSIYYVSTLINKQSERVQEQQSRLSTYVQEAFSGIRVLKSFVRERQTEDDFERENLLYKRKSIRLATTNAIFFPLILVLIGLSTILTIYVGGMEAIAGKIKMGTIAEFIIYINMLTWPVASVGWVTSLVNRAAASQERINEFLETKPEIISPMNGISEVNGKIEFRNVSFVYPDSGVYALTNVSFKVEEGHSLAILGRTGSGKSTIANLIARMYDATKGEIFIGNNNIRALELGNLRSEMGMVPQDVFLFSDTIANNISFGLIDFKENGKSLQDTVESAARDAAIYSNIIEFPRRLQYQNR